MRAEESTRRLLDFDVSRRIMFNLCRRKAAGIGYRELQRLVQGADYMHVNKTSFDHWIQLLEKCMVIVNRKLSEEKKATIRATDESKLVYRHYANILRIPDISVRNTKMRKNRVLVFLNILMPSQVAKSNLPWNLLKKNFPYLRYPLAGKMDCDEIENVIGMPFVSLISQRPFENKDTVFTGELRYSIDEIQKLSANLEIINNSDIWGTPAQNAIEVNGKINVEKKDRLLCAYIERLQILLLAYKFWEECRLISGLKGSDTLKDVFSKEKGFFRFDWYESTFGTRALSTYVKQHVNRYGINYLRTKLEDKYYQEAFSQFRSNVWTLLSSTVYGEKYQETRKKYSLFINEMQDIVLQFNEYVKERYKA